MVMDAVLIARLRQAGNARAVSAVRAFVAIKGTGVRGRVVR